jgi:hypothetical protein
MISLIPFSLQGTPTIRRLCSKHYSSRDPQPANQCECSHSESFSVFITPSDLSDSAVPYITETLNE